MKYGLWVLVPFAAGCGESKEAYQAAEQFANSLVSLKLDDVKNLGENGAAIKAAMDFRERLDGISGGNARAVGCEMDSSEKNGDGSILLKFHQDIAMTPPGAMVNMEGGTGTVRYTFTMKKSGSSWKVAAFAADLKVHGK